MRHAARGADRPCLVDAGVGGPRGLAPSRDLGAVYDGDLEAIGRPSARDGRLGRGSEPSGRAADAKSVSRLMQVEEPADERSRTNDAEEKRHRTRNYGNRQPLIRGEQEG